MNNNLTIPASVLNDPSALKALSKANAAYTAASEKVATLREQLTTAEAEVATTAQSLKDMGITVSSEALPYTGKKRGRKPGSKNAPEASEGASSEGDNAQTTEGDGQAQGQPQGETVAA